MDSAELARQLFVWYQHEFDGIRKDFFDLEREGRKVRLTYKDLTHVLEFEGDEGGKGRPSKPFVFSVYSINVGEAMKGKVAKEIENMEEERETFLSTKGSSVEKEMRTEHLKKRKFAKFYRDTFKTPEVSLASVTYDGKKYEALKVSAQMRRIPRGKGGSISPKLFECGRREISGVVDSAVREYTK